MQRMRRLTHERLSDRCLLAGDIVQAGHFYTWDGGTIPSTDVAGITYHPPSGHLYLADSEINELPDIFTGANVFETSLTGEQLFREITTNNSEPTGITYSEFDGYFYVTNDTGQRLITRYDSTFSTPLLQVSTLSALSTASDPEGITSDPVTGHLYVVDGSDGGRQILVYNADLQFQYHFSVAEQMVDAEGIAFHPVTRHLFAVDGTQDMIFEYTLDGTFVESYNLNGFQPLPRAPQGLTFAPTSDPTDDPSNLSLYIADGMKDNFPDGQVFEAIIGGGAGENVVQSRVSTGSDDAEERPTGSVALTSSDLELTFDSSQQTVGLRFTELAIPPGAIIQNATIQFETDKATSDPTSLTIRGQAADNAATFTSANSNITSRPLTSAVVNWDPPPWLTRHQAGPDQRTPNLAAVIQEIVDRPGWNSGNSLAIIIQGTGKRMAKAYEGSSAGAPLLRVEFEPPGGSTNTPPTTSGIADVSVEEDSAATVVDLFAAFEDGEDPDSALIYTIQNNTNPALFSSTSITPTLGQLALAYAPDANGSAAITVRATDRGHPPLFVETTFNVNVTSVNDPPVPIAGSLHDLTVATNGPATSLGLSGVDYGPGGGADESGQTLSYEVTAVPSAALGSILLADGTTVVTPGPYTLAQVQGMQFRPAPSAMGGPETFSYRVSDDGMTGGVTDPKSIEQSLQIQVTDLAPEPVVLQLQVATSSDDAEERPWGKVTHISTDLDLTLDATYQQTVGIRFPNVAIPPGSIIQSASIQFQVDDVSTGTASLNIRAQAADNAPTFIEVHFDITTRPRTSAVVTWTPAPWLVRGQAGPDQQTPNLAAVIQEVVNRPGWSSGNALAFIIDGMGERVAEAFDGDVAGAPKLIVEFLPPTSDPLAAVAAAMAFTETSIAPNLAGGKTLSITPLDSDSLRRRTYPLTALYADAEPAKWDGDDSLATVELSDPFDRWSLRELSDRDRATGIEPLSVDQVDEWFARLV